MHDQSQIQKIVYSFCFFCLFVCIFICLFVCLFVCFQVGVNGIISFDRPFAEDSSVNFPSMDGNVHFSYLVAPYWSDIDTRRSGTVHYEYYNRGNSTASDQQLDMVRDFIRKERDPSFEGEWMLLAAWENVHPYPHGESADLPRENPYLESVS